MSREKYLRLGELLIKEGLISASQLEKAVSVQRQEGGRLGEVLVKLDMIKEGQMVAVLGKQLNIPYFSLGTGMLKPAIDQGLEYLIPQDFALKNSVLPLSRTLRSLTVAIADPGDLILIDNLRKLTSCEINPVIATKSDISKAIEGFYGKSAMLNQAVKDSYDISGSEDISLELDSDDEELSLDKLVARAEEAPVIKLVDLIIRQAINERASDIHIEPFKNKISLRYRIDGKLYEISSPAKHLHMPIISRVKILAKLDIAEKRLPQDGAFMVKIGERPVDIRVSSIPTIYGEKIVMRLLDRSEVILDLNRLGFDPKELESMRKVINAPYGLVFLTGPTGSGKTTTLYAILSEIKIPTKNIITVEDPIEYKLEGINQVQVKPEIGLTFSVALRSFLRQDPDIMLVGEVRDLETAEVCIRSALTGHLVLSTLHTNDAPTAVSRLMDIGIEPYMLAPSLLAVVAQRLVRKLCPDCKEAYEPTKDQLKSINLKAELIYRAKGCAKCNNTGYRGRICIAEVLVANEEIRDLINQKASFQKIREAAKANGMLSLYEAGIKKVEDGITSLEDAFSVTLGVE
ncbi:MAG: type II secretion system protein GspE [Candidatus Omnitrophica bacterium CG23_combo_of_CG06-09_8_20_14_all_41_10]|uniref:Type II secretion system protein GspE n=1 Tax=Candidatus Sherwoodlollariibacterium unditelluris TaxID=1974757 RepID=A0A2G9YHM1_9BACT|nr:MAG: type II secretion system protein GspE [Candidatus Omnitrophica bacterium CG23_combo_of_CG06-09_8_20_14_all_41_10]